MYRILLNSINSLSAEEDKEFHKHLIETKFLKRLNTNQSDIVYGTKGVGKTALSRALTELNSEFYFNTIAIDLDSISFEAVYESLSKLNSTVKFEMHNLARATWKNILLNYALLGFIKKTTSINSELKKKIEKVLKEEKFLNTKNQNNKQESIRVLNTIENFFHKIISIPFPTQKTLSGISVEQQDIINKFPINDKLTNCLKEVSNYLKSTNKKVLVCIDGFDSIVKHTSESREAIFAGLIDAVYFFRLDTMFSEIFAFKAFLPQELTLEANRITWDGDKHANNIHYISWDELDFKLFIEKRFAPFSKRKQSKFNDLWNEFMPEKLINPVHNIEENTFDYILRHTLYRPRQILNHISFIIMRWDETTNTPNDKIHPSFIPPTVAKNNKIMAGRVVEHLSHIYPNISHFLRSWQGSSTIISVLKFKEKIFRYLVNDQSFQNYVEIDKIFDELFDFGIFGIKANSKESNHSKRIEFKFAFVGDNVNSTIHNFVGEEDLIAFSPMFREFCGCNSTPDGIIVPINLDEFG